MKVHIIVLRILLVGIPPIKTGKTLHWQSDDDGLLAQRQVQSVRRLERRGLGDLTDSELVGFHGTCSNAKDSIEKKIESSKHIGQLGFGRFYVADADGAAAYYAKEICGPLISGTTPTKKEQPVLCSVYMNRDYLLSLKKVYVPQYLDPNHHNVDSWKELFWNEEEIKEWEKTQGLEPKADVLRFGRIPNTSLEKIVPKSTSKLMTAWSSESLLHMAAECEYIDINKEYSEFRKEVGYRQWMRNGGLSPWGKIVAAAEYELEE